MFICIELPAQMAINELIILNCTKIKLFIYTGKYGSRMMQTCLRLNLATKKTFSLDILI